MIESTRCPKCGIALPADAPAGLCPKCLVQAGFESQVALGDPGPTRLTPPNSGFEPLTVEELAPLFPQLQILELLGKGGMGAVYKGRQPGLDRLVALKILPPEISHDAAFAERFTREARALARLSHPHIVAVYDFGVAGQAAKPDLPGGLYYIVMEFVDGTNLRETIRAGKLAAAEALAIVPQICEALQFAHDEGIVHRDIKPENILIDKRGRVKIADFGLAKLLGTDASDHSLTATHQVMGTLRYMAPEQMQGSREVDHRADIYSLGVVFYELLTGELPMGKFAPPSKKVQVDVRLDEIVLRALEQEPEQRYQHASQIKSDVEGVSNTPIVLSSAKSGAPLQRPVLADRSDARLSRFALVGAIWAGLGLLAAIILALAISTTPKGTTLGGILHVPVPLFALFALSAPIGTTILGAIGIAKIKRSDGKLYGLRLAQADALLFPLLAIGALAFLAGFMLLRGQLRGLPPFSSGLDEWFYQSPRQEFVTLLIALPIWFFPARALFRAVVGPHDAFELRKLPLVGDEPLTGKAALVVALAAIAAHGWPWHWIIPPNSTARTISNFDVIDALQSFWLLVLSIGLALFASSASLARPAKLILRVGSVIAVIAALVIQVQFYRSLGEYEPGQPTVVRLIRTYSHMGVYVTMALTGLTILFFLLRIFDEKSDPVVGDEGSISPERRVKAPAIWLLLTGLFAVVQGVVLLILMGLLFSESQFSHGELVLYRILGAALVAAGIVIGIGAWHMLQMRGYRWAVAAAILGQPLGIWSLVVLTRRDVKAAFDEQASASAAVREFAGQKNPAHGGPRSEPQNDLATSPGGATQSLWQKWGWTAWVLISLVGSGFILAEWATMTIDTNASITYTFPTSQQQASGRLATLTKDGREIWQGIATSSIFVAIACLSLATWHWQRTVARRRSLCITGSLAIAIISASVIADPFLKNDPDDFVPTLEWYRDANVNGAPVRLPNGSPSEQLEFLVAKRFITVQSSPKWGSYGCLAFSLSLLFLGIAEFAFLRQPGNEISRPHTSIGPEQISLWAAISGVLLPALLLIGSTVLSSRVSIPDSFVVLCFLPGVGLELVAFGCGLVARGTKSGKAGLIISSISLVLCPIPLTTGLRTTSPTRTSLEERQRDSITKGSTDTPTRPKTGEEWSGNKGDEQVRFFGWSTPTVSDRLARHLGLNASQRAAMNQAFQKFFRDLKALEEQNTRHETDANGHQITTITAIGQQVPPLADRFWSELDSVLDGRQLTLGRKTVGLGLGMFESDFNYQVEIWRVGQVNPWFHWKESYPGRANVTESSNIEPSSGPELPEKLRRFWKEPVRTDM